MNSIYDLGIQVIIYLQSLGEGLVTFMKLVTFFGNEDFYILIMPALFWCVDAGLGLRLGIILMLSNGLNFSLKLAFHGPRPPWYSPDVRAFVSETSFGAPSGHAMNAVAVWGFLIKAIQRTWVWLVFSMLILLIGLSRPVLGIHFLFDVITGWAFGLILLWLSLRLEVPLVRWLSNQRQSTRWLVAYSAVIAFILLGVLVKASLSGFQIPSSWIENAANASPVSSVIDPFSLSGLMTSSGAFFGLIAGALWLHTRGGFSAAGALGKRLLRFPLGLLGIILIWYGLGAVFPRGDYLLAYTLRFSRYFLVGVWVTGLAPMVFLRLNLAQPKN